MWCEGEILDPGPIMSAYPVTLVVNGPNQWTSFHWDLIKEIRKSVQTYGLQVPFTQALLDNVFTGNILTPGDCRQLAEMILTPT